MAEGVILKLSTEAATRSMSDFDRAALAAFRTMEQQSGVLRQLEQQFARQAAAEESAAKAAASAAAARKRAHDEAQRSFGIYGGNLNPGLAGPNGPRNLGIIPDGLLPAAKAAEQATNGVAQGAAKAAPLVQKFAGALGGSAGLGKALGAVGGAAQLFLGAVNPLYIAVGLAAAAVGEWAIKLATAESPLEKTARLAKEAQLNFNLVGDSAKDAATAIERAANATDELLTTGAIEKRLESARERLQALERASEFQGTAANRGSATVNIDEIGSFARSIQASEQVIQALGRLATATGLEYDKALRVVREAGIPIGGDRRQTNTNSVSFQRGGLVQLEDRGTVTLSRAKAQELLNKAIEEGAASVRELDRALLDSIKPYEEIRDALRQEIELQGLGNREREVTIKTRELAKKRGDEFSESQKRISEQAIAVARSLDLEAAATRALADATQRAKSGNQAGSDFTSFRQGLDRQIALAKASPADRERLELEERIRVAQIESGATGPTGGPESQRQIRDRLTELNQLDKTARQLEEIKDVGRDAFQTLGQGLADAALQGKNLRQTLNGLGSNLSSLLLNRAIGAATNSIFGQPGGQAQLGRVLPSRWMMGGGVLDRSQTIVSGGYAINVAEGGGASPEAVIPLARDQFGRLGVRGEGGGGGVVVVNLPNVRSGADARAVRPTLSQTIESVNRRGRKTLRAGR